MAAAILNVKTSIVELMSEYILEMRSISKEFPGVRALDHVTFNVRPGEIHALVGENGAGKSTLMKILSGAYPYGTYDGEIVMDGVVRRFNTVKESERAGVAIIYQELALVRQLNVCENVMLGSEISRNGLIDWNESYRRTQEALRRVGLRINPAVEIRHLGVGEQQLVEIAKALLKDASVLILDEPTAALSESESKNLLNLLKELKAKGTACIYISHRLKEALEIADRITVLRDGKTVATDNKTEWTEESLISKMVGRELVKIGPRKKREPGDVVLEIKNWSVCDSSVDRGIEDVNLMIRKREILGLAGLVGAGRTEMVMSLFGAWGQILAGQVFLDGKEADLSNAGGAVRAGVSLASEDRKRYGLVLTSDVKTNISLASLEKISNRGVIDENEDIMFAEKYCRELKIKTPSIEQRTGNLSGGNQQKVVLGKWLMTGPKVLILDEPTRGIDVGARFEIHEIIRDLADRGVGLLVISSDLPELLGLCDRIAVMHEGKITGELSAENATQEEIMRYATGEKRAWKT